MILALETSCDDTCAAVVTARRRDPLQRHLLAGHPRPLRRRRARGRLPPPPRARQRRRRRRAAARRRHARRRRAGRRHRRARAWSARCSSASRPPRRWPRRAGCRSRRSTTSRATSPRTSSPPDPFEPPFLCLVASRRPHAPRARDEHGGYELLGQHARRRRRRGVRQGRAAARPPLPRRPGALQARAEGDPQAFAFPTAQRVAGLDFSFAGLKTALLYKVRDLGEEEAERRARRPRRLLPARDRRGAVRRVERALARRAGRAAGDRRRRRRQRPAARARAPASACRVKIPPPSCAPTTRR